MARLILDLDETSLVVYGAPNSVHRSQTLSRPLKGQMMSIPFYFRIINPQKLSDLIQYAYKEHEGVMIVTSGCYEKDICSTIASNLDLPEDVRQKFADCSFHSPLTDCHLFGLDYQEVRDLNKFTRIGKIIQHNPALKNVHYVFVDDDFRHLNSFRGNPQVTPILATTDTAKTDFYEEAKRALDEAKKMEMKINKTPNKPKREPLADISALGRHSVFRLNGTEDSKNRYNITSENLEIGLFS